MPIGRKLYQYLHPTSMRLPARSFILLEKMYPNIDWKEVVIYNGMPWFMPKKSIIGTAQPSHFIRRNLGIYFREFSELSPDRMKSILVHEAYHIQQYHDLRSGIDWGFNNEFMRLYFAWNFQMFFSAIFIDKMSWGAAKYHAYRQHPMEVAAYDHEADFYSQIRHFNAHEVGMFLRQFPSLRIRQSKPVPPPRLFFYIWASFVVLLIAISRPLIESILNTIALLLGGRLRPSEPSPK